MMLIDNSYKRTGNIEPTKILQLIDISEDVKNKQDEVNKTTIELCNSLTESRELYQKNRLVRNVLILLNVILNLIAGNMYQIIQSTMSFKRKRLRVIDREHGVLLRELTS